MASAMYEPVIGLEVHAELQTRSKMFCACPVVDLTQAAPNSAVCPVCAGMPGTLPVVNQQAVEFALRVALALECEVAPASIFARKNYFYPDLPKGYQISQYETPLATNGRLAITTRNGGRAAGAAGEQVVRIRRVHLEEDTGKLTHVSKDGQSFSLVDLNRAGVALLEVVSEPDLHSMEAARAYAMALRSLLRYLGVNSGDMEKGVIRFEANVSLRPAGSETLGTRVEIKNLNSFRAMERAIAYEVERQSGLLRRGESVRQETLGWDDAQGVTFTQRGKEEAHDYRYFPEPDLPPLVVEDDWLERVRAGLPELPAARLKRFQADYELSHYDAAQLTADRAVADFFEGVLKDGQGISPKLAANWVLGDLFALMRQGGTGIESLRITAQGLADLLSALARGEINNTTGKLVLAEMAETGDTPQAIIARRGLSLLSDTGAIARLVAQALDEHPDEVASYLAGKLTLAQWFVGQVMKLAGGQADAQVARAEVDRQLKTLKS